MNPELPQYEKNINVESEKIELLSEQKKMLGQAWCDLIIDGESCPENIGEMSIPEIKTYLFGSLMRDIGKLFDEFGFHIDSELAKKIEDSRDVNERSELELEYIKKSHAQVDAVVQNFTHSPEKSTRWDSWPKYMRETKEFNCVGATLLGMNFLRKAGIRSYYGNPHGHVLNMVKLSNGEWWYVDFNNGSRNVFKIDPKEAMIAGVPTLFINQSNSDYRIIPLFENIESPGSILGNLDCLFQEANEGDWTDNQEDQQVARSYLERYRGYFDKIDFGSLREILYPNLTLLDDSEDMKGEKARIDYERDFEKEVTKYTKTLSKEEQSLVLDELRANIAEVENFFYKNDDSVLSSVGPELQTILNLFAKSLLKIKDTGSDFYTEAVDKIVTHMKRCKNLDS